ncbi:MAG: DNA helicase PcrA [Clostridia bacterium]|nr:DNA helicase PcrA [Clostridia bacterium]
MSELLNGLNEKQREAAMYVDGPLLILAGAGSGKTRTLTYKMAYLLEEGFVKPWEILAITFTNKAAKEMKSRVESLIGENGNDIWLGTFHSICVRILKREISLIGYSSDFNIFDDLDKEKVIKEVLKKLNIDDKVYPVSLIKYEISSAKDKMIDYIKYRNNAVGDFRKEKIADVYEMYQKTLKQNNALDFDDILMLTVQIFIENPDRLEYYQNKFKYILVDEYQDTNKVQFILISLLAAAHGKICVVGDESQSIYGFRGADIANILNFEKEYPNAKVVKLEENYRSTQNILNAANGVIKNNQSKIDKKLWTGNGEGQKICYRTLPNEYEEVEFVVEKIDEACKKEKKTYSDFAVLFRTNAQARVLEEVFMRNGTPYRLIGGLKFYSRKEIKDLASYLKLIQNTNDNISLKRIINEPKRGIGDTALDKLDAIATEQNVSIFEVMQDSNNLVGIRSAGNIMMFREMINEIISLKNEMKISDLMKTILKKSGYEDMLNAEDSKESEMRFENLMEFIGVAMEFENEMADATLADFLDSIALVSDVDKLDESTEAVTLMTMHSAKGLEFDEVFLVGMEDGLFPSKRSIDEVDGIEEERRLCYVGITRAKERLYITNASKRTLYGSTTYTMPSRFIDEIDEELLDEESLDNKSVRKKKSSDYLDKEYSQTDAFITRSTGSFNTSKSNFGLSVDNFLKNISGVSAKPVPDKQSASIHYTVGTCVKHKKFGAGIITKVEPEGEDFKLDIQFENSGFKRLMANFTPLEVVK